MAARTRQAIEIIEWLAGTQRTTRQAHQLARAKPRPVEQLEESKVTERGRLPARRPVLGSFEHACDLALVENARQRSLEARAREGFGRIVLAKTIIDQERVEAPERGRTAGDCRWGEFRPLGAETGKVVVAGVAERLAQALCRALEIVAVGGQRVPRRARLRRHHVEEPVDERRVLRAHVRDRPSAAIIRAVKSWSVRFNAMIA